MSKVAVNDRTPEPGVPAHVRGLIWKAGGPRRVAFNSLGGVDLYRTDRPAVENRVSIDEARAIAAAMAAYDADSTLPPVVVEDSGTRHIIGQLERAIAAASEQLALLKARADGPG